MDYTDYMQGFVEMVYEILDLRLKRAFGKRKRLRIGRCGGIRGRIYYGLLHPRYVTVVKPELYDRAWTKIEYKLWRMKDHGKAVDRELMKTIVDEVIEEMKGENQNGNGKNYRRA